MAFKPSSVIGWLATTQGTFDPGAPKKTAGFAVGERPPNKWVNWFWALTSSWVGWLDSIFDGANNLNLGAGNITTTGDIACDDIVCDDITADDVGFDVATIATGNITTGNMGALNVSGNAVITGNMTCADVRFTTDQKLYIPGAFGPADTDWGYSATAFTGIGVTGVPQRRIYQIPLPKGTRIISIAAVVNHAADTTMRIFMEQCDSASGVTTTGGGESNNATGDQTITVTPGGGGHTIGDEAIVCRILSGASSASQRTIRMIIVTYDRPVGI